MGESASEKFWNTPELVEMLFPHLDASSILDLSQIDSYAHLVSMSTKQSFVDLLSIDQGLET